MPRHFRPFLLLAALWFAGDRAGASLIGRILDHSREPIAQLYGGSAASDVVVVGNSRAYRNLDTDEFSRGFGGRTISLAQPGMPMDLAQALFEDYVDRYGAPRVLVIELSALFSDAGALKDLRIFSSRSGRVAGLTRQHFPTLYRAGLVSALFTYNSHFTLTVLHKVFYPMPDPRLDGVWATREKTDDAGNYFVPRTENFAAARNLVDMARRCMVDVRLVMTPVEPSYAAANKISEFRTAVAQIAGDLRVWDLADTPPVNPQHLVDPTHLNRDGLRTFMNTLSQQGFYSMSTGTAEKRPCVKG